MGGEALEALLARGRRAANFLMRTRKPHFRFHANYQLWLVLACADRIVVGCGDGVRFRVRF